LQEALSGTHSTMFAKISVCGPSHFSSVRNLHVFNNKLLSFNFPRVQEMLRYSPFLSSSTHDPQSCHRKPQKSSQLKYHVIGASVIVKLKLDFVIKTKTKKKNKKENKRDTCRTRSNCLGKIPP